MRKRAFALLLGILIALAFVCWRTEPVAKCNQGIFSDGFESGDFSAWTGTAGSPTVVSTNPNTGTYCEECASSTDNGLSWYCYKQFTGVATVYVRFYVWIDSSTGSLYAYFGSLSDNGMNFAYVAIGVTGATNALFLKYRASGANNWLVSATTVATQQWTCIEVKRVQDASNGEVRVYKNGVEVTDLTVTEIDTSESDVGAITMGQLDIYKSAMTSRIDDVVVDSAYIGPISGDTTSPTHSNVSVNSTFANHPCSFSCLWADETNMSGYVFGTNNTGSSVNETWTSTWSSWPTTRSAWANVTQTLNSTAGYVVQYEWWANDTSNNWSNSDLYNLTLTAPYTPTLQLTPTTQTCRKYGETFTINMTVSDPVNVTSLEFEIHYNTTLLSCSSVTLTAWGSGTVTVDQTNGVVNGSASDAPLNDNQTLLEIQFTATYHHIWKTLPGWTNDINGTIYIQSANLTSSSQPNLTYIRGTTNQINVGPDVTYTFSPIKGDADNNGQVDIQDLATVASYYDQTNDTYNLTGDPNIDIYDLVVIASNFWFTY